MSDHTILLVDAGYLIKSLTLEVGIAREDAQIDYQALTESLAELAAQETGSQLLRQTWYDASPGGSATQDHRLLASIPGVHVRLGWLVRTRPAGQQRGAPPQKGVLQQKGVDGFIVRDLVVTALHRVASQVVLIAGDGDLVPGVMEAVDRGVRVHLWGVSSTNPSVRQSDRLIALADKRLILNLADLTPHVKQRSKVTLSDEDTTVTSKCSTKPVVVAEEDDKSGEYPEASTIPSQEIPINVAFDQLESSDDFGETVVDLVEPIIDPVPTLMPRLRATADARLGPPPLDQVSPDDRKAKDLEDDEADILSPEELGSRYGQRWWDRSTSESRTRLISVARRPGLPRLLDVDLMRYAPQAGIVNMEADAVRRELRAGFWMGIDQVRDAHSKSG